MRKMKDSGVQWIGEMPESWSIIRFKYLHNGLNTGEAIDKDYWSDDENSRVFYTAGLMPIKTNYPDFPAWKYTTADDLLLARNGTPYVYFPEVGACYTDHIIRASMKAGICKKYVKYCLQCSIASVIVETVSIPTWSASLWNKQELAWPSYEEQITIADFLDKKCAQVDTLIANVQAQIEKLKAYKQSVITEVVTKGLDPTVPMKDSGVEWIGEIPEHWDIIKLKYITYISRGLFNHRPRNDPQFYDGEYPFIQTGDVARAKKYITTYSQTLNERGKSISKQFPKGTMTMTIAANVGDVAILGFDAYFPDSVVGFTVKEGFDENYVYYLFQALKESFIRASIVSTQLNLNIERSKEIIVSVSYDGQEQKTIAVYLDEKCSQIDRLIALKQSKIEKLEQYKKSLIYEYVTGKKEVP